MDAKMKPLDSKITLEQGAIIRRIGNGKDQQGCFLEYDDEGNLILINIIDMLTGSLFAVKGVLKPKDGDTIYYFETNFSNSPVAAKALKILNDSSLFKTNKGIQQQMLSFTQYSFTPEQIIEMQGKDTLNLLFVPLQEKFRIGRFQERRDPIRLCVETFGHVLETIQRGNHITYIAQVMQQKGYIPRFYTIGTEPHEETVKALRKEYFNFEPNFGGHIKASVTEDGTKLFILDAGSNVLGRGNKTPLHAAQSVAAALKKNYPEYEYKPLAGRGAFGTEQSY
jgi:hypothetical protein